MAEQYLVRTVNLETGEETVSEPSRSHEAAVIVAERTAETYFDGDDRVTWFENAGGAGPSYHVGRILEDGSRSEPLATIRVEEHTE